jgi:hypothetical protein
LISAETTRRDVRAQQTTALFTLTEQHRELWSEVLVDPALVRVLRSDIDVNVNQPTEREKIFVTLLILHLDSTYKAIRAGLFKEPSSMSLDINNFLSLPIPFHVWTANKSMRNADFVKWVEKHMQEKK